MPRQQEAYTDLLLELVRGNATTHMLTSEGFTREEIRYARAHVAVGHSLDRNSHPEVSERATRETALPGKTPHATPPLATTVAAQSCADRLGGQDVYAVEAVAATHSGNTGGRQAQ